MQLVSTTQWSNAWRVLLLVTMNVLMPCNFIFLSDREESILQDIQPHELHGKIQDPNFLEEAQLIDVREPEEV